MSDEKRYCLFVECKQCKEDIPFKNVPEPKPDDPPLTSRSVQLQCPNCEFEAVYKPAEIQLGVQDQDE
jgi:hypothetical protein